MTTGTYNRNTGRQSKPLANTGAPTTRPQTQKRETRVGFAERKAQDTIYVQIAHGGLVEVSKEPKIGFTAVSAPNKRTGETLTKYIRTYDWIGGHATKLVFSERRDPHSDFTYRSFKLHLDTGAQPFVIDLDLQGRAWRRLAKMAPNIDWAEPIEVMAWFSKADNAMAFAVSQDGENVRQAFTKENPGKLPKPKQSEMDGKWDFREHDVFLFRLLRDEIAPAIEAASAAREQAKPAPAPADAKRLSHDFQDEPTRYYDDTEPDFDERLGF